MKQYAQRNTRGQLVAKFRGTTGPCLAVILLGFLFCLSQPAAQAQDTSWTSANNGLWTDAGSWSAGVPSNNPTVWIENAGSKTVTINAATPAGNLTITNLNIRSVSGVNTLLLSGNSTPLNVLGKFRLDDGGQLVVDGGQLVTMLADDWNTINGGSMTVSNGTWLGNNVGVGWGSSGALTLAGGTNNISQLLLSQTSGSTGTVLMTGGQLVTTNGNANVIVGNVGIGVMTVSNGTWLANTVSIAGQGSALTLAGGTNAFAGNLNVGSASSAYTGSVWLTGGRLETTNSTVTVGNAGVGAMTVSNGTWLANNVSVANGGAGTLTIAGGTNVFSYTGHFVIGQSDVATVLLTGGLLVTTNSAWFMGWAGAGVAHMTVTGGRWLAKEIKLGMFDGNGSTLTIAGGQVFVADAVTAGNVQPNNSVLVTNGGLLEANTLVNDASAGNSIRNVGGIYQFTSATPTITPNGNVLSITNGTISFRNVESVDVNGNWSGTQLANMTFGGTNAFRLDAATNATSPDQSYTFAAAPGGVNYARLELLNGSTYRGGNVTVGAGGALVVTGGVSTLSGNLTLQAGSTYRVTLGSTSSCDRVAVGGNVTLAGGTLDIQLTAPPLRDYSYVIIANDGANPVEGHFASGSLTASYGGTNYEFAVLTNRGDGNDVVASWFSRGTLIRFW